MAATATKASVGQQIVAACSHSVQVHTNDSAQWWGDADAEFQQSRAPDEWLSAEASNDQHQRADQGWTVR